MDLKRRALDLESMGVQNIWLIDPESRAADRWEASAWHPVRSADLPVPGTPI